ncbi:Fpg/Nei family DNA glycosylase [Aeoliella sp.]|uniref:Fpg/Nei family DNA glycosylase n=1 Tax=Aeoliella sp. TaxID=2795800 RepID=UPI003CCC1BE3
MPELPDVTIYCEALQRHYAGTVLVRVDIRSPFVVRTFDPDIHELTGRKIDGFRRMGKRIVWEFSGPLYLVMHLMVVGRLHERPPGRRPTGKHDLAAFHFAAAADTPPERTLMLTEQGSKRQASIAVLATRDEVAALDPGGLEVEQATLDEFRERLTSENHTLKRALTDPRLLSGIGNAYSDEILHAARLSPIKWTTKLTDEEFERLYKATRSQLTRWTESLREEVGDGFPERVTAFRGEMAVHGRYGESCPVCGGRVARIRYATRETNYCPKCQTGGKLLADRSLSRLLKGDWEKLMGEEETS